jgi:hypothetical protein
MKIYLVLCGFDYEGTDVKACLSTRIEADALVEKINEKKRQDGFGYHHVSVAEWSVGEIDPL